MWSLLYGKRTTTEHASLRAARGVTAVSPQGWVRPRRACYMGSSKQGRSRGSWQGGCTARRPVRAALPHHGRCEQAQVVVSVVLVRHQLAPQGEDRHAQRGAQQRAEGVLQQGTWLAAHQGGLRHHDDDAGSWGWGRVACSRAGRWGRGPWAGGSEKRGWARKGSAAGAGLRSVV